MKSRILKFILGLIFGFLVGFLGYYMLPQYWPKPKEGLGISNVREIHASYPTDYENDQKLMGASHHVFVVKIIKELGVQEFYDTPFTQFEVEIIQNIKGDWEESAIISQEGGYKDGVLWTMEYNGNPDDYLFKPGETYILATRFSPGSRWHTLNPHPNARKTISEDPNLTKEQLVEIAKNDPKVQALQEAYQYEILLDADIYHNNTLNSYKSLHPEEEKPKE